MNKIEELVKLSKKGSKSSKEELIHRLKPLVLSSIKKYYYGSMSFEDLVQEGRTKILAEIIRFDEEKGVPFLGYIKIHMRYLYMELSKRREEALTLNTIIENGTELIDLQSSGVDIEEDIINSETSSQLREALKKLTERQKLVLDLIYIQGMSMKEVSQKLNLHYQTVIGIRDRGLKRLREELTYNFPHFFSSI